MKTEPKPLTVERVPFTNDTFRVPGCNQLDESERLQQLFAAALAGEAAMNRPDQNPAKASVATARDAVAMERHGCRYADLGSFWRIAVDAEVERRLARKPDGEAAR